VRLGLRRSGPGAPSRARPDPLRPEASGRGEAAPGLAGPEVPGRGGLLCRSPARPCKPGGVRGGVPLQSRSTSAGPVVSGARARGDRCAVVPSRQGPRSGHPVVEGCWSLGLRLRPSAPGGTESRRCASRAWELR